MPLDQVDVDDWEIGEDGVPRPPEDKEMSFIDHLEELRWHVMRSLVAIALCGVVLFIFREWYFRHILFGTNYDDFLSYGFFCWLSQELGTGEALCMTGPNVPIQATEFGEQFITAVKMSFVGGFVVAFPYVFHEIWAFIRPGLYKEEQRATRGMIFICSLLFFIGVSFGYFVIAPFGTNFLMGFEVGGAINQPKMNSLISYMVMFTLPAALIFQLPVLIHFLSRFGLVTAAGMRKYRKHSFIGILVLASILTPPDVVTQVLIAVPLYILYEISVFIAKRGEKNYLASLED